jgi:hypothetical protein
METLLNQPTLNQSISLGTREQSSRPSIFRRFLSWCEIQEQYRFGWLAVALSVHGCALTPITLFAIILSGTNIFFFVLALIAMGMTLVSNLAALPTKITIPVFFFSIAIDLAIITSCALVGFDIERTYI